jgi:lipid-A-disaccharide synthase-like uncharacterized protein
MKWEPAAAMVGVLALGFWLVYSQDQGGLPQARSGAITEPVRIADQRGVLEAVPPPPDGDWSFRLLYRDGTASPEFDEATCKAILGERVFAHATERRSNWMFRLFNITSWTSMAWVALGLGGQIAFSGRMLLQWFVSEKKKQSVVPEAFWWLSLIGGIALFSYFVWRQDVVGVLGQSSGLVIYARNIRLISKRKRREARAAASAASTPPPHGE